MQSRMHLDRIREAYFRAYVGEWRAFLDQVAGVQPDDRSDSLRLLQRLTGGDPSPLSRLFQLVAHHTSLELPPAPEDSLLDAAASAVGLGGDSPAENASESGDQTPGRGRVGAPLLQLLEEHPWRAKTSNPPPSDPRYVATRFAGFLRFAGMPGDPGALQATHAPLDVTLEQLRFVRDRFQTFLEDESTGNDLLESLQRARTEVRGLVEAQDVGWRPNFDAMLWPILDGAAESSVLALGSQAGREWCADVWEPFQQNLRGTYPFDSTGPDASLDDFHGFFAPGQGQLWGFREQTLADMVRAEGDRHHFVERVGSDTRKVLSGALLAYLDRAAIATRAFYSTAEGESASGPRFPFEVRILPAPGIAATELEVDGKRLQHVNGPERWTRMVWPRRDSDTRGAAIEVRARGGVREALRREGSWGLFRLLELGEVHPEGNRVVRVRWQLSSPELYVEVLIRPERTGSPLSHVRRNRQRRRSPLLQFLRRARELPAVIAAGQPGCGG